MAVKTWVSSIFIVISLAYQANALCRYGKASLNSEAIGENSTEGITCYRVPEASGYAKSVCAFRAQNATDVSFKENSFLADRNQLVIQNSTLESDTLLVQMIMIDFYSPLIDRENPILRSPLVTDTLLCTDLEGDVNEDVITVEIKLENTQAPEFDYYTYSYEIPDSIDPATDITGFSKVFATDKDNNFEKNPNDTSTEIMFEIEEGTDINNMFGVISIPVSRVWPYKYRALIYIVDTEPLDTANLLTFNLIAKNTGDNSLGTITSAEIRVNVNHVKHKIVRKH